MKHPLIIFGTAGLILMLGGTVWAYLFLFYQPTPENARIAENPFVEVQADEFGAIPNEGEGANDALSPQSVSAGIGVTARRVAGTVALNGTYRIIEAGTGHAYEIAEGGAERKISNTTFPQTVDAVWAASGERVVLTREADGVLRTFIVTLGAEDASEELNGSVQDIAWSADSKTLKFTRRTDDGSQGVALNIDTKKETVLFSTPLRDITVLWEPAPLIMTRSARTYIGYAYRTDMSRVTDGTFALNGAQSDGLILFSGIRGDALTSWFVRDGDTIPLEQGLIPEKCAILQNGALCASPKEFDATKYPDQWYRGEEIYDDEVVYVDAETGAREPLGDLAIPYRMPLDIVRAETVSGGALMQSKDGHAVFVPFER